MRISCPTSAIVKFVKQQRWQMLKLLDGLGKTANINAVCSGVNSLLEKMSLERRSDNPISPTGYVMSPGAKLALIRRVSARIVLAKLMMPCSKFLFLAAILQKFWRAGGRGLKKNFPDSKKCRKNFSVHLPVKTWVKPLFLDQYL
jgi:hypothetical protein